MQTPEAPLDESSIFPDESHPWHLFHVLLPSGALFSFLLPFPADTQVLLLHVPVLLPDDVHHARQKILPAQVFHVSAAFEPFPYGSHFPGSSSCPLTVPMHRPGRFLRFPRCNSLSHNFSALPQYFPPSVHSSGSWKRYYRNVLRPFPQAASEDLRLLQTVLHRPLHKSVPLF